MAEMMEDNRREKWPEGQALLRHLAWTGREGDALDRLDYMAAKAETVIEMITGAHVGLRAARLN